MNFLLLRAGQPTRSVRLDGHHVSVQFEAQRDERRDVSIVVDDLDTAAAFFTELGLELQGNAPVEGRWVDRVNGLGDVRVDIVMMGTPDGHGRLELTSADGTRFSAYRAMPAGFRPDIERRK